MASDAVGEGMLGSGYVKQDGAVTPESLRELLSRD